MEERIIGLDSLLDELNEGILGEASGSKYIGISTVTSRDLEKLKSANKKAKKRWLVH